MKYHPVVNSIKKSSVSTSRYTPVLVCICYIPIYKHFIFFRKTITFCWQNEQETNKIQAFRDNSMNVLFNIRRVTYNRPTATILLSSEKMKAFPLRPGRGYGYPFFATSIQ